jgi:alkylated DNA repair dioxygenase AlkB
MQLLILEQFDAPINYFPNFLSKQEADWLFTQSQRLTWQQNQITMLGKVMPVPRLETIYGDSGCDYLYSHSVLLQPKPWTEWLLWLKEKIETTTQHRYHITVGNRYRSGRDSISWHSDDEPTMGKEPAISSVSLGATRRFSLKSRQDSSIQHFDLEHGSLLLMRPGCQSTHLHQVPKSTKVTGERINWTFRPHINGKS